MSRRKRPAPTPPQPAPDRGRYAVAAAIVFATIALVFSVRSSTTAEIDLRRLGTTSPEGTERATLVIEAGRVWNRGEAVAENVEILAPRYRLVGTILPGESVEAPAETFRVRYEWPSRSGPRTETKLFERPVRSDTAAPASRGGSAPSARPAPASSSPGETLPAVAAGLVAAYDPATHLLTIRAGRTLNVRADGFLLRPVRRTDENGIEYRYLPANVLVLGQNLGRGEAVAFEVVFTRPQDHYALPLYVWEDGGTPSYVEVGVAVGAAS